jgi:AcrR family transcriptional regulator
MGAIAEAVAIGPSALYRHFANKQQLLEAVIGNATTGAALAIDSVGSATLDEVATVLTRVAIDNRNFGVLWQREARQLPGGDRREHQRQIQQIVQQLTDNINANRADLTQPESGLLARCALAAANSISFHHLTLPDPEFPRLLADIVYTVLTSSAVRLRNRPRTSMQLPRARSRREEILTSAVELISERGFAGVSMDDIGAVVGIVGPALYKYFPSKADLLAAVLIRGDEWLQRDLSRVFAQAGGPEHAMSELVRAYNTLAYDNPHLARVLVSESHHLSDAAYQQTRAAQHAYLDEWVHLLRQVHSDWTPVEARIRVHAVQMLINDAAIDSHVHEYDSAPDTTFAMASTVLDLPGSA